jgi:hypothetical protein
VKRAFFEILKINARRREGLQMYRDEWWTMRGINQKVLAGT